MPGATVGAGLGGTLGGGATVGAGTGGGVVLVGGGAVVGGMNGGGGRTTGVLFVGGAPGARAAPPVPWQYAGLAARPKIRASASTCSHKKEFSRAMQKLSCLCLFTKALDLAAVLQCELQLSKRGSTERPLKSKNK